MHSFLFHLGDYATHTSHLSPMEDLAYRRLIDLYYLHESPPIGTPMQISRRIRMPQEIAAVEQVLNEFFEEELTDSGENPAQLWRNKRCDQEIEKFQALKEHGRKGAAKRWDRGGDRVAMATPMDIQVEPNANHEPLTINLNHIKEKRRGSRFDLVDMPDDWLDFCKQERQDIDPRKTFDAFRDYWIAQPGSKGVKADWIATWRNWVRNTRVSPNTQQAKNDRKSQLIYGSWERKDDFIDMGDANAIPLPLR